MSLTYQTSNGASSWQTAHQACRPQTIIQLSEWMKANTFKLNADKTHFLVMGTSNRLNNMVEELVVMMEGERLEESKDKSAELLGVTMQCNLKWSLQIESLAAKLKTRLTGLEKLKYVMNRNNKKNIVEGVFNSVLCFCLPLFGGCNKSCRTEQHKW